MDALFTDDADIPTTKQITVAPPTTISDFFVRVDVEYMDFEFQGSLPDDATGAFFRIGYKANDASFADDLFWSSEYRDITGVDFAAQTVSAYWLGDMFGLMQSDKWSEVYANQIEVDEDGDKSPDLSILEIPVVYYPPGFSGNDEDGINATLTCKYHWCKSDDLSACAAQNLPREEYVLFKTQPAAQIETSMGGQILPVLYKKGPADSDFGFRVSGFGFRVSGA